MENASEFIPEKRSWLKNRLVLQVIFLVVVGPLMIFLLGGLYAEMRWSQRSFYEAPFTPWLITAALVFWMPYRLTRKPLENKVANDPLAKVVIRATKLHFEKDMKGSGVILWAMAVLLGGLLPSLILIPITSPNTEMVWFFALPMVLGWRFFIPQWLENREVRNALTVTAKLREFLGDDIGYYVAGDRGGIAISRDNQTFAFVRMDKKKIAKSGTVAWNDIRKWGERESVANTIRAIGRTSTTEAIDVMSYNGQEHNKAAQNTGLYLEYDLSDLENDRIVIPLKSYQAATWSKIMSRLKNGELASVVEPEFVPAARVS
ncbi:hypothetical protein [Thalassospira profundimaris]|uniref:hypothetical protein n=1 Tax=Thalassospira profundimaris TaxID=502049 RepID=UPI0011BDEA10|nr:hypothetical protein [Thalassospira profundimaris]